MKKMKVPVALALLNRLAVTEIEMIDEVLTLTAVSMQVCPCCPLYGTCASRVHSLHSKTHRLALCRTARVRARLCVQALL